MVLLKANMGVRLDRFENLVKMKAACLRTAGQHFSRSVAIASASFIYANSEDALHQESDLEYANSDGQILLRVLSQIIDQLADFRSRLVKVVI